MQQIRNVRFTEQRDPRLHVWENVQLGVLGLTIFGQVVVGASFLVGQFAWLIANTIALIRDFVLQRPIADKVKDGCLWAITLGLIVSVIIL